MLFVELMIDQKSFGDTLEQLLTIAEDDSRVLQKETELIRVLKKYNHIRKMDLYRGTFTRDMESMFDSLIRFKKYPQAVELGRELAHRYETEKNILPGKLENMLKQLVLITNPEDKKKYKNKLYGLYMKENNWKALQDNLINHMTEYVDDVNKKDLVKAGVNELLFVLKIQFQQYKEEIIKQVTDGLEDGKPSNGNNNNGH